MISIRDGASSAPSLGRASSDATYVPSCRNCFAFQMVSIADMLLGTRMMGVFPSACRRARSSAPLSRCRWRWWSAPAARCSFAALRSFSFAAPPRPKPPAMFTCAAAEPTFL